MTEQDRAPLTEEAVRLLAAVQQWTRENLPAGVPDGHTGPECRWCPLCRLVAVLRGERPELTARVAEAGVALVAAVRGLLDAAAVPDGAGRPSGPSAAARSGAGADNTGPAEQPRVQHIDLGGPE